ncbi:DUF4864 domain-containing protein [Aliishimia ponticola]|uniref:DUF4864 domain-containing protein n=1 Tax=Aliishimia ponticola TaxID=2499833 RepID=A0A4S4N9W9_9RHOB|nr:DUF4864 domain-containing protein [Aliishimia ponticola]THH35197.1 DUF4864 domain-containing protein [Aliishimia ponticola]
MRILILSALMVLSVLLAPSQSGAQDAEIQGTISAQIDAFRADDFGTAFGFAHTNIQRIFRTPENFGRMVTQGYPMVWRPADITYLDLREENGQTFQDVQIVDRNGRVFVLEYLMQPTPDGWRIAGVQILRADAFSA